MNILNIKLASIDKTDLGFEHWVDVTYTVPILKNEYLVSTWKYRDLVLHSVRMYEVEREGA